MIRITEYAKIIGKQDLEMLFKISSQLSGYRVKMINSTKAGGGVAEILQRMTPLLNQLGIQTKWEIMPGENNFFQITKKMFNLLHGAPGGLSPQEKEHFLKVNQDSSEHLNLEEDFIFIHDHQPAALIEGRNASEQKWIWRCHSDVSSPNKEVWEFLLPLVEKYDCSVFSSPAFAQSLRIPQYLIPPSIDPLSEKNKSLESEYVKAILEKHGLDIDRPILTQISRFDKLKDPLGLIEAYKMVKKSIDCQLVLCGGGATDDPEGELVLNEVKEKARGDKDIHVLYLVPGSDLEVNALQRGSTIIIQKSLREGFALTVTEGLWKRKPVIASAVGGIPMQIIHNQTGILVHSIEGTAHQIKYLLTHPEVAQRLGVNGYQHVLNNFLITRHVRDYILTMLLTIRKRSDTAYLDLTTPYKN